MTYWDKVHKVAELLRLPGPNFALTGAGVSTESGIPDFRSAGTGLWENRDPINTASVAALRRDPADFYKNNFFLFTKCNGAQPNAAHLGIARLEKLGYLVGVITQNVDGLHQKAGSRRVWEVHGHLRSCHCLSCKESYPFSELSGQFSGGINPPICKKCGGVLRPDVVLFGDPMSEDYYNSVMALTGCQLMLVAGSSLQVHPVAALPEYARRLVIINRDPTSWDEVAEVVINESVGKVFNDLLTELED